MPEGALPVASAGREDATCLPLAHYVCPQPPGPQPVFPGAPPMGLARGQLLDPVATRGGLLRVSKKKKNLQSFMFNNFCIQRYDYIIML